MRTPDYVLTEEVHIASDRILPVGAFVRPIVWDYLPRHIREAKPEGLPNHFAYCYTRYGIIPIPKKSMRCV